MTTSAGLVNTRNQSHNSLLLSDHGEGGQAVDVKISGADALRLIEVAKKYSMTGIGVKQSGPAGKRFIHLDNLGSNYTKLTGGPRPWLWSYA